eukprot:2537198-Rhodomonas_salina.2
MRFLILDFGEQEAITAMVAAGAGTGSLPFRTLCCSTALFLHGATTPDLYAVETRKTANAFIICAGNVFDFAASFARSQRASRPRLVPEMPFLVFDFSVCADQTSRIGT